MSRALRILVLDDDPLMGSTLSEILTLYHYSVIRAQGSREAMELVKKGVDCVLSDIVMPGKDGVQFQKEVIQQVGNIPFLFMTAYAEAAYFKRAKAQGAVAFLEKPVKIPRLLEILQQVALDPSQRPETPDLGDIPSWDPVI
jgi:response regulator NasT